MAISKVTYGGRTLMDLTGDTVTSAALLSGYTAHGANGEQILGSASTGSNVTVNNTIRGETVPIGSYIITGQTSPVTSITISDVDLVEGVSELAEGQVYVYIDPNA